MSHSPRPLLLRMRAVSALSVAALACTLVAACGSSSAQSAPGSPDSITLYNGQHQQTTNELVAAFEKSTGIHVDVRNDDEDVLANQIALQGASSPADVMFTENSPPLEFLQEKDLLAPVPASTLAQVPARFSSAQGDWLAVSARVSVMIYNPKLIKASQLPRTALEMADPKYKGKLALAAGETDFQPIVTSMLHTYGEARTVQWLEGVKANAAARSVPDNETIASDVNRGLVAFGLINEYYWYRMRSEIGVSAMHSQLAYFQPRDPGYVIDVAGAAVMKNSAHLAAAERFLAFLVSKKGQEIIAHSQSYEYPLLAGVSPQAAETPFNELQPNSITISQLGDGSTAIALLQRVGLL
ncbi:MAG TPA: extracellular solute-binding protein [Streptosporangiaceae bacterium]|nr:extracellular solute-binding protein [Streptosporangiaceae bacterium]